MSIKYTLSILYPGEDKVCEHYESDTPFGTISTGDIIRTENIHETQKDGLVYAVRAKNVEHSISKDKEQFATHRICVYTEYVQI